jgi:hypothetical protein
MTAERPFPLRGDFQGSITRTIKSFARALIAFASTVGRRPGAAEAILQSRFKDDRLAPLILRAATSPLTISGAPGLAQVDLIDDIMVLVGKTSAGVKVLQAGLVLRFDGAASIGVPLLETNASKVTFVAEGAAIPVAAFSTLLASVTPHKLGSIVVLTSEMLSGSNAETLVIEALRRSVGLGLDNMLFDSVAASSARPAGLRNGIAALTAATTGTPSEKMAADIATLAAAVGAIGEPILVAGRGRVAKIKTMTLGQPPYPTFGTPGVAETDLLAIAENGVASVLGQPTFDSSTVAALHMSDTPVSDLPTGVPVKSMWQTDSQATKVLMDTAWLLRDARALAWTAPTW